MSHYLLRALEILSFFIFAYLNRILAELVLTLLCPALVPFVGLMHVVSMFTFMENRHNIFAHEQLDIISHDQGTISTFNAVCSSMAAGFSAALWYPSIEVFNVLTGREPLSSIVPECVSSFSPSF